MEEIEVEPEISEKSFLENSSFIDETKNFSFEWFVRNRSSVLVGQSYNAHSLKKIL